MNNDNSMQGRAIRVGLLGSGYIADWHAKALAATPGIKVAAICDRDEERAESLARRCGDVSVTTSIATLLEVPGLDAIHVLLPPELHFEASKAVLLAGKHVFLEKPMAVTVAECVDLIGIASRDGCKIGVGHNFLFARVYENLKADVESGKLGQIDHVTITWNKPLGQISDGPFDSWLFRDPSHVMLEIGPHSFAHAIDLLGDIDIVSARASNPIDIPGGRRFFQRWTVEAESGRSAATLQFSFSPGFSEHRIQVRGRLASAIADFENNTYVLQCHTKYGIDLDRYLMTTRSGSALRSSGRSNLIHYVLSKFRMSSQGNPYGEGIDRAVAAFYNDIRQGGGDRRISADLGRDVVRLCVAAGQKACPPVRVAPAGDSNRAHIAAKRRPEVLILGATGFIGKELTRQLLTRNRGVRALVRNASRMDSDEVEVVVGDMTRPADLARALDGIDCVIHLARSMSKTWDEYYRRDVVPTRQLAEACLDAGVRRFLYASSIDAFYAGGRSGTIDDATPLDSAIDRRNNYARSKAASEALLMDLHKTKGLPLVILRPGIVIGTGGDPRHWGVGMWPWESVCQVWGNGRNGLPIVLVEDVANALILALDVPGIEGDSFNLVGPQSISARDYLKELEAHANIEIQKHYTAPWKFFATDLGKFAIKVLVRHPGRRLVAYRDWKSRTQLTEFDCTKARERLGWVPTEDRDTIIQRGIQLPAQEFLL